MFWLLGDVVFADFEAAQVFEREIDAALGVIDADVLPEIRQLQRGAGEVGELLALGIAISAEIEHEMADGIRGVVAIGQDVVEGFEARDGLILAEGDEQVGEFVLGNVELAHGFSQRHEYWMFRSAFVAGIEFVLPLIEEFERGRGVADFVAQIVGDAAVGVDVEEMLAQAAGKEPTGDGEIFVVGAGQAGAVFAGLGERGRGGREWRSWRAGGTSRGGGGGEWRV